MNIPNKSEMKKEILEMSDDRKLYSYTFSDDEVSSDRPLENKE